MKERLIETMKGLDEMSGLPFNRKSDTYFICQAFLEIIERLEKLEEKRK